MLSFTKLERFVFFLKPHIVGSMNFEHRKRQWTSHRIPGPPNKSKSLNSFFNVNDLFSNNHHVPPCNLLSHGIHLGNLLEISANLGRIRLLFTSFSVEKQVGKVAKNCLDSFTIFHLKKKIHAFSKASVIIFPICSSPLAAMVATLKIRARLR